MSKDKTIIFLPDGMADEPIAELGGMTPLQVAHTPGMDSIASRGKSGTLLTLPTGFPTSSDVANMSVLGCDLPKEYCGRGVLEAYSQGVSLGPDDVAFRVNLVTVSPGDILTDFSGGHIAQDAARELIDELNRRLADDKIRFHPGVSYRNLLVLSGSEFSPKVHCDKPDDNYNQPVADHLPQAEIPAAEPTAQLLRDLMEKARAILSDAPGNKKAEAEGRKPANAIWPWSGGRAGAIRTLRERFGISGAVISAVDVIKGLGRALGMDVINVPGATGYIDTDYDAKAKAAIEAARAHDLVYVHLEGIDEVSHEQSLRKKIKAIEDFDEKIVRPVMKALGDGVRYAVLPDHPVPISLGRHTRVPVPVAVCGPGIDPDAIECYSEIDAPKGKLGALFGPDLMGMLFGDAAL